MIFRGQTRLPESGRPIMEKMVKLYDHAIRGCVLVGSLVAGLLVFVVFSRRIKLYFYQAHLLEAF